MAYLDYSHLGSAPSFAPEINAAGDQLLQAIKIREARKQAEAKLQYERDVLAQHTRDAAETRGFHQKQFEETQSQHKQAQEHQNLERQDAGVTAVRAAYEKGGAPAAKAVADQYGIPFGVEHNQPAPGAEPQLPADVAPPERPADLPIPGTGLLPPEARAMMAAAASSASKVQKPEPPPEAAGAIGPPEEQPPAPTAPPSNGDAVDQVLNQSRADELAAWETKQKAQEAARAALKAHEASLPAIAQQRASTAMQGAAEQGGRELDHANAQQQHDTAEASYPDRMRQFHRETQAYESSAAPTLSLMKGQKAVLPSEAELKEPKQKDAEDFMRAEMTPLVHQLGQARDPAQVAQIRFQIAQVEKTAAGISSGAVKLDQAGHAVQTAELAHEKSLESQSEGDKNRTTRLQAARIMADRAIVTSGNSNELRGAGLDIQERKERSANLRKDLTKYSKRFGLDTVGSDLQALPQVQAKLMSDNPVEQLNASLELYRMAQKDSRMSDKDAVLAKNFSPAWTDRLQNWISQGATGTLDPQVRDLAVRAAQDLETFYKGKLVDIDAHATGQFAAHPELYDPGEADQLLSQMIPGREPVGAKSQGPLAPSAQPKAPAGRHSTRASASGPNAAAALDTLGKVKKGSKGKADVLQEIEDL